MILFCEFLFVPLFIEIFALLYSDRSSSSVIILLYSLDISTTVVISCTEDKVTDNKWCYSCSARGKAL